MAAPVQFDTVGCVNRMENSRFLMIELAASNSFLTWESNASKNRITAKNLAMNYKTLEALIVCDNGRNKAPRTSDIFHCMSVLASLSNVTVAKEKHWAEAKVLKRFYSLASRRSQKRQTPRAPC